jgi:hypothetical protein
VGESECGWLEAPSSGEAVNGRASRGRGAAGRSRAGRRRRTEGEDRLPGEGGGAHPRGSEVHGPRREDDAGRATVSVGAEPPTPPEGSKPNVFEGGREGARHRMVSRQDLPKPPGGPRSVRERPRSKGWETMKPPAVWLDEQIRAGRLPAKPRPEDVAFIVDLILRARARRNLMARRRGRPSGGAR